LSPASCQVLIPPLDDAGFRKTRVARSTRAAAGRREQLEPKIRRFNPEQTQGRRHSGATSDPTEQYGTALAASDH
jgi:hypothetical protein